MRRVVMFCAAVAAIGWSTATRADGLVYRLPEDGAKVKYDLEFKGGRAGGEERTGTGSLTISSVGQETVDNEKCRWIEFRMATKIGNDPGERVITSKLLIPEKHIGKDKSPGENIVRGWIRMGEGPAQELKDLKQQIAGPLAAFLTGPLKDAKDLEKAEVESKLGKLPCAGQTGTVSVEQGDAKVAVTFENRLHEKAPFGVVTAVMKFDVTRNGMTREGGTITMKLADVGTKAVSELPDNR